MGRNGNLTLTGLTVVLLLAIHLAFAENIPTPIGYLYAAASGGCVLTLGLWEVRYKSGL